MNKRQQARKDVLTFLQALIFLAFLVLSFLVNTTVFFSKGEASQVLAGAVSFRLDHKASQGLVRLIVGHDSAITPTVHWSVGRSFFRQFSHSYSSVVRSYSFLTPRKWYFGLFSPIGLVHGDTERDDRHSRRNCG